VKSPIIIKGSSFPWSEPNPHGAVIDDAGEVNWAAAAFADPGCMKCPGCGEYLWQEGEFVRCPHCSHEFETPAGKAKRERVERLSAARKRAQQP